MHFSSDEAHGFLLICYLDEGTSLAAKDRPASVQTPGGKVDYFDDAGHSDDRAGRR